MERIPSHHLSGARFRMSPRYLWNGNLRPCSGRKILWVDFLKHKIIWCLWSFTWPACFFSKSTAWNVLDFFGWNLLWSLGKTWGLTRARGHWTESLFLEKIEESWESATQLLTPSFRSSWWYTKANLGSKANKIKQDTKGFDGAHHPLPHVTWHPIPSCVLKEASPPVPEAFDITAMEGLGAR